MDADYGRNRHRDGEPRVCNRSGGSNTPSSRGTESSLTCMGLFLSSSHFWLFGDSLFGAGMPFFVPSPAIRFAERAEGVKGPKRLAKLGGLPLSGACVSQRPLFKPGAGFEA